MKPSFLDKVVEGEPDHTVRGVIVCGSRRNVTCSREENGPIDVLNQTIGPFFQNQPVDDGKNGTNKEEE